MERNHYLQQVSEQFDIHPVVALLGPRQVGKTTLAHSYAKKHPVTQATFFDLENPIDLAKLQNPMLTLSRLTHQLIVIDEIQRRPELFPVLRVLADEHEKKRQFLILGSASRDLLQQSSESLAGRIAYIELPPFSLFELAELNVEKVWARGGFPRSYLAKNDRQSLLWRKAYISTFLERDIPNLGFAVPPEHIRRFWMMLANNHGQLFNASEFGRSMGLSDHTVKKYLDILVGTFMVRRLQPWFENISKRQVKTPKVYFRDSGILNALLSIGNYEQLYNFPKAGAFWEGFALEEVIRRYHMNTEDCYFWATQGGAELDLFFIYEGKRLGFEFKLSDSPKITPSMRIAINDLQLDHLYVVFPGEESFPLSENITAAGLVSLQM